ncbi:hypothetical protein ASPWEDRAFT_170789 [Aspergillus wentii DTO 134E9]|uniref:DUF7719 domain-containing protein n=1 Tax=Aspergillus wentii DTO 134E9 TaxID=1073089 RepID=A0A1L9RR04_ASPWE|nr:uncharacterized protein ASPWEDRAFT_170789 [Aspergillus wentii DTO 134E9]KAI9928213.1 hypothetical protein MW887_002246 [Aspergillus wentii]OJJ37303.1 hypothetical protein ASPWEDRAFT_170789 [Aspergillus wentii DTO 134E9]
MEPPRNRKQRRTAAAAATDTDSSFEPSSIPLAHPPRETASKKKKENVKTLYDIIAERQNELGGVKDMPAGSGLKPQFMTVDPASGKISGVDPSGILGEQNENRVEEIFDEEGEKEAAEASLPDKGSTEAQEQPLPPFIDTILLSFPLTTLHLTLGYLAAHQYAEKIVLSQLVRESAFIAFPILTLLVHLAHGHVISLGRSSGDSNTTGTTSLFPLSQDKLSIAFMRKLLFPPTLKTVVFLSLAIFLGNKLMTITNEDPYYAVMKRAPAIGTLWVWSILEIPVGAAALGALGPLGWGVWWKGYGIF